MPERPSRCAVTPSACGMGLAGVSSGVRTIPSDAAQTKPNAEDQKKPQDGAQPSTPEVKPGSPVLKQKDLWEGTGVLHPLLRMPKYILQDQKAIWTSPFHTSKQDMKFWAVFGTATAAFIATDQWSVKQLPNSSSQVSVSKWASLAGSAYSLIPDRKSVV